MVKVEIIFNEARKLADEANKRGLILRIMGAIAIRIHCPNFQYLLDYFNRVLSDIDFAAYSYQRGDISLFLNENGYVEDIRHAFVRGDRIIFTNPKTNLHIDIFYDKLDMCHTINFKKRLTIDHPTIPLSELLLEKLQIIKIAEKDIKDILVLLREHQIGETDKEEINSIHIAKLLSNDWGFFYTVTSNLKRIRDAFLDFLPTEDDKSIVRARINTLLQKIEEYPKSFKWKVRSKIGTKVKWYNDVEDVHSAFKVNNTKHKYILDKKV